MRKSFLTIFCFSWFLPVIAQQVKVTWGTQNKKQYLHQSFLSLANGNWVRYSLNFDGPAPNSRIKLTKAAGVISSAVPVFASYDNQMKEQAQQSLKGNDQDKAFQQLIIMKGNHYLLTRRYDATGGRMSYYSEPFDFNAFLATGKPIPLGSFETPNRGVNIGFGFSSDSSRMYLFGTEPTSKKESPKYFMAVYDETMKKLWQRTIELPYPSDNITLMGSLLSNDGKLLVMVNHYEKDENASTKRKEVRQFVIKMLMYEDATAKPSEHVIKFADKATNSLQLVKDYEGNLDLFGLYTNGQWGVIKGYYFISLNTKSKQLSNIQTYPFSEELLKRIKTDKQHHQQSNELCLAGHFILQQVMEREDGSKDYIVEYARVTESIRTAFHNNPGLDYDYYVTEYQFGDIIDINVKPDGKHILTRIPKNQLSLMSRYGSFRALPYKDKIVFFYNDHEDNPTRNIEKKPEDLWRNLKKGLLVMAVVDAAGNVTRSVVAEHSSKGGLPICVRESRVLDNRRIALYALTDDRLFSNTYMENVGILEIK